MACIKKRLSTTITFLLFPILLELLTNSSEANQSEYHTRINDGLEAVDGQFPYAVLIIFDSPEKTRVQTCTGSLIQLDLVLTAAHCFISETVHSVTVMAGKADAVHFLKTANRRIPGLMLLYPQNSPSVQVLRAKKLITHPQFEKDYVFDLALARLEKKFTETKFVKAINYALDVINPDMRCIGLGYGQSKRTGQLYFYGIKEVKNAVECSDSYYKDDNHTYCLFFHSQHTCKGDSGSPIVCNGSIYSITSRAQYIHSEDNTCVTPAFQFSVNIASAEKSKKFLQNYAKPSSPTSASRCITVSQWLTLLIGLKLLVL